MLKSYIRSSVPVKLYFKSSLQNVRRPGTAVDIVSRYWFDGPRIELRWGQDFPQSSSPAVEQYQSAVDYDGNK